MDEDEALRQICHFEESPSTNMKVADMIQALCMTWLEREEADRQNTHLGSVDDPATRSNIAVAATTNGLMKFIYCQATTHKACYCEL
jgi:hypothetical protein